MAQRENFKETNLDILFHNVIQFRSSKYYRDMMNMCGEFRHLSPYNAMLINMQKPGARYVLKKEEWEKKYHRLIKPNAQPLIILVPFGPIDYYFEIGDTEPEPGLFPESDDDILASIARPYKTKQNISEFELNRLMSLCAYHGIAFDLQMNAGVDYGAKIELLAQPTSNKDVHLKKNIHKELPAPYLISVNKLAERGEQFASVVHELGHLFCHHLRAPRGWTPWPIRSLPHNAEEFEAESVSWLICERLNIGNPSERYLSQYLESNNMIPYDVSVEAIFQAFTNIWDILRTDKPLKYNKGMLYKYCPSIKKTIDRIIKLYD